MSTTVPAMLRSMQARVNYQCPNFWSGDMTSVQQTASFETFNGFLVLHTADVYDVLLIRRQNLGGVELGK